MKYSILTKLIPIFMFAGLTACQTVSYPTHPTQTTKKQPTPTKPTVVQEQKPIRFDKAIADRLAPMENAVRVSNILYVASERMVLDGVDYTLLDFHTTDKQIYRTRVESNRISAQHFEKLKKLKGATLIGVIPVEHHPNQYFFKYFRNLAF